MERGWWLGMVGCIVPGTVGGCILWSVLVELEKIIVKINNTKKKNRLHRSDAQPNHWSDAAIYGVYRVLYMTLFTVHYQI